MAPNASGDNSFDHDAIVALAYAALRFSVTHSERGAAFLCKLWSGPKEDKFVSDLQRFYGRVDRMKPKSSRKESAEMFVLAQEFKGIKGKAKK